MKSLIRSYLCDDENHRFFGEGPFQLLSLIEETGSLRSAALSMNMAYTKALRLVKDTEAALGYPVTVRKTGGKGGGGSCLTPAAKDFIRRYEAYRNACSEAGELLYHRFFPDLQNSGHPAASIGCVIMASGLGIRFGANKLMADFHGVPLIRRILDATSGLLFSDRIVVTRSSEVSEYCQSIGVPVLLHTLPNRNDTLRLGLSHLLDRNPALSGCLFALGDQPLLRASTLQRMCHMYQTCRDADPAPIIRLGSLQMPSAHPSSETGVSRISPSFGTAVGNPILFHSAYFDKLLHLPEKAGGSHILKLYPEHVHFTCAEIPEELMDVDTPEELEHLQNYASR